MTQADQTIGPDYSERVANILHEQGLLLPSVNVENFVLDSKLDLEEWLADPNAYYSCGGVWLEHDTSDDDPADDDGELWQIHFTPPYIVEDVVDGMVVKKEINLIEPGEDFRYSTILAGVLGITEYIAVVEAGYLPKPDLLYGITNKKMAEFATRRLGFELDSQREDGAIVVLTDYDRLKSATQDFIKKFGSKITKLGIKEIKDLGPF